MRPVFSVLLGVLALSIGSRGAANIFEKVGSNATVQCSIQESASIPDCNCRFESVNHAVTNFISPILTNLTRTPFFRYFLVDLQSPCPYWKENGQCGLEACSVCTCDDSEIPSTWRKPYAPAVSSATVADPSAQGVDDSDFGWITTSSSFFGFEGRGHDESLGKVAVATAEQPNTADSVVYETSDYKHLHDAQKQSHSYLGFLHQTENCAPRDLWTVLSHDDPENILQAPISKVGVYVNLLTNPERFTGYAGPSAARVWRAIQEENCFGGMDDLCLEKRVFSRLISGLRASISVHIARNYLHNNGQWGQNMELYHTAVGNHPDRVENVYFAFLFLLRAVVKAKHVLHNYPYHTGNATDDQLVLEMIDSLVTNLRGKNARDLVLHVPGAHGFTDSLDECSLAFDETSMFQVDDSLTGPSYWQELEQKHMLREEFRLKFRNISRIMDCVTCEKCRLWGKLQLLGFGTAIKVLLSSEEEIHTAVQTGGGAAFLNRQEVIALVNVLNQFAKSVEFAAHAQQQQQQQQQQQRHVVAGIGNNSVATTITTPSSLERSGHAS